MNRTVEQIDSEIKELKNKFEQEFVSAEIPVYSRITGFYGRTAGWNRGKKEELKQRTMFKLEESMGSWKTR